MTRRLTYDEYKQLALAQRYSIYKSVVQRLPFRPLIPERLHASRTRSNHDGRLRTAQNIEESLTDLQTTVLAAARMGRVHKVYHMKKSDIRENTYHLGDPQGRDVTTQILALARRGFLAGVEYIINVELD